MCVLFVIDSSLWTVLLNAKRCSVDDVDLLMENDWDELFEENHLERGLWLKLVHI